MNILQAKETKQFIFKCHSHDMLDCLSRVCVCVGGTIKLYIQLREVGEIARERERREIERAKLAQAKRKVIEAHKETEMRLRAIYYCCNCETL